MSALTKGDDTVPAPQATIKEPTLRELIGANAIRDARVAGCSGGYVITVVQGRHTRTLVTTRGTPRMFTLDNASRFLCSIGVPCFQVDASNFVPGRIRKPRPDRAEALKRTKARLQEDSLF